VLEGWGAEVLECWGAEVLGCGYLPWAVEWCRAGASTAAVPQPTTTLDTETIDATTCTTRTVDPGAGTNPGTAGGRVASACERCPD